MIEKFFRQRDATVQIQGQDSRLEEEVPMAMASARTKVHNIHDRSSLSEEAVVDGAEPELDAEGNPIPVPAPKAKGAPKRGAAKKKLSKKEKKEMKKLKKKQKKLRKKGRASSSDDEGKVDPDVPTVTKSLPTEPTEELPSRQGEQPIDEAGGETGQEPSQAPLLPEQQAQELVSEAGSAVDEEEHRAKKAAKKEKKQAKKEAKKAKKAAKKGKRKRGQAESDSDDAAEGEAEEKKSKIAEEDAAYNEKMEADLFGDSEDEKDGS
jgi:hypothetical protein